MLHVILRFVRRATLAMLVMVRLHVLGMRYWAIRSPTIRLLTVTLLVRTHARTDADLALGLLAVEVG
jgi:hypothetical protein